MATRGRPPLPVWFDKFQVVTQGLVDATASLLIDGISTFAKAIGAFPNVWEMADIFTRFATGLPGRILSIPFAGFGNLFASVVRTYYGSRLMRPEDAARLIFKIPEIMVQSVTMTGENSLFEYLVQGFATWIYRTFKQWKMIYQLYSGYSEGQFVEGVVRVITGKLRHFRFLLVLAVIVFILCAECLLAAYVFSFGLGWVLWTGDFEKFLLPQDSKRIWKRGGRVARQNVRAGPDR